VTYLRFVVTRKDEDSGRRQGLFQALADLEQTGALLPHEHAEWTRVYEWFRHNLKEPDRFAVASRPHAKRVAISWFKDGAVEHLSRMRGLFHILEDHGFHVTTLKEQRVGYVVYEDNYQVVAEPFADTAT
jgi:hypothetical protein